MTEKNNAIDYLKGKHPELWFWLAAFIIMAVTASFKETVKIAFVIGVGVIWVFIMMGSKFKAPSLIAFIMFLAAWLFLWKIQ